MDKELQNTINAEVMENYNKAMDEYNAMARSQIKFKRLRSCSAEVCETENYYILRSYATFIAVIDKETCTCYDALRKVYGYTNTSGQHVAKFRHDYPAYAWHGSDFFGGCKRTLTYYYC